VKCKHNWVNRIPLRPKLIVTKFNIDEIAANNQICLNPHCRATRKKSLASGNWIVKYPETPAQKYKRLTAKKKKSKYKNESCQCLLLHIHRSRGEARYCNQLRILHRAGKIKDFEPEYRIELKVDGIPVCNHYIDWRVTLNNGKYEFREYKGFTTAIWKLKRALTQVLYPEIPYIVIWHK